MNSILLSFFRNLISGGKTINIRSLLAIFCVTIFKTDNLMLLKKTDKIGGNNFFILTVFKNFVFNMETKLQFDINSLK